MKLFAVLGALLVFVSAFAQNGSGGYGPASAYSRLWNASKIITINGKVTGKLATPPYANTESSVAIMVKQDGKEPYEVQLGPDWYVSNVRPQIETGDQVTVMGSRVMLGNRSVIMAEVVTKGKTDITFRDKKGVPYWIDAQRATAAPTGQEGTIVDTGVVNVNGIDYTTYRVNTGTGTVDIVAAPAWYMNRQDTVLQIGNNVQIIGAIRPYQAGYNLFVADSFYAGNNLIVLRPYGF